MLVIKKAHVAFVLVQAFSLAYLFEQNRTKSYTNIEPKHLLCCEFDY